MESSIVKHWEFMKMGEEERREFFDTARKKRLAEDKVKGGHLAQDGTQCGDGLYYHPGCTNRGKQG
jgi:hypothetical protein